MDGPIDPRMLGLPERLLRLKQEQWRGECRRSFLAFATHVLRQRGMTPARHHRAIIAALQALVDDQYDWLLIIAPPGSGKTYFCTRLFAVWYLALRPGAELLGLSHTADFAMMQSREIHQLIRDHAALLGYGLANDSRAEWVTTHGATYKASGAGGAIRGRRAALAILDDPIASRQEAESEISRRGLEQWFESDLRSRLTPTRDNPKGGKLVCVGTCYHEDDLLAHIKGEKQFRLRVLRLPAISEGETATVIEGVTFITPDPCGRPEGEPIWSDQPEIGYHLAVLAEKQRAEAQGNEYEWWSMWMGLPRPPSGGTFRPGRAPRYDHLPVGMQVLAMVRGWDLAATVTGDWTATVLVVQLHDPELNKQVHIITDARRMKGTPDEVKRFMLEVTSGDDAMVFNYLPEDPGQAGKMQAQDLVALLLGKAVFTERQTGPKAARAFAAAGAMNEGLLGMLKADWNRVLADELAGFPFAKHDDLVDALAIAFNKATDGLAIWARL
jgi:predicted phage terminase large subunit-like protein